MKSVLLVYYSQTGQLQTLAEQFAEPLRKAGVNVEMMPVRPQRAYPFPWPFWRFFNTFPETVHLRPEPIEPPQFARAHYDAVVLAYTAWFLSPSQPITAFLQHPAAKAVLCDTPVITLIGCRNMWLMAQEAVKALVAEAGGRLVGNIVKIDACSSAASFITTPAWLLSGQKQLFRCLPPAGIEAAELADGARFGKRLAEVLQQEGTLDETLFRGMGAARVNEQLIFSEKAAKRSFLLWGRMLMKAGRISPLLRRCGLGFYVVFLIGMIVTVVPISALFKRAFSPWLCERTEREKVYFGKPSGE